MPRSGLKPAISGIKGQTCCSEPSTQLEALSTRYHCHWRDERYNSCSRPGFTPTRGCSGSSFALLTLRCGVGNWAPHTVGAPSLLQRETYSGLPMLSLCTRAKYEVGLSKQKFPGVCRKRVGICQGPALSDRLSRGTPLRSGASSCVADEGAHAPH